MNKNYSRSNNNLNNRYTNNRRKRLSPRQRQIIFRKFCALVSVIVLTISLTLLISGCFSKAQAADNYNKYFKSVTIERGETLYDYADRYADFHYDSAEEYISEVAKINSINPDRIIAGNNIIIPYYSLEVK